MTTCPLCNQSTTREFPIYYEFNQKRFQGKQCPVCSFVYLSPRPTPEDLKLLYSDDYFLYDGAECGAHSATDYETAAIKGSVKFPEILGWIKRFRPSGDFFEIGCGMGYFLHYARSNGYTVSGIEYAELGMQTCRDKFGLDVERCSFEEFAAQPERFDVIFMGDVLEHLTEPLEMLRKAHSMLRPSGVMAAEVPSMFNSLTGRLAIAGMRIVGKQKRMLMPPYHVNEFLPDTLRAMFELAGFRQPIVVQRIKPPSSITLRGGVVEKAVKKILHYPNYGLTKSLGILGDRLLCLGIK